MGASCGCTGTDERGRRLDVPGLQRRRESLCVQAFVGRGRLMATLLPAHVEAIGAARARLNMRRATQGQVELHADGFALLTKFNGATWRHFNARLAGALQRLGVRMRQRSRASTGLGRRAMAAAGPLSTPVGLLAACRMLRRLGWQEVEDNFRVLRQCQDVVGKKVACGGIRLAQFASGVLGQPNPQGFVS